MWPDSPLTAPFVSPSPVFAPSVLHYTRAGPAAAGASGERSVRCRLPQYGKDGPPADTLAAAAMTMFR